MKKELNRIGVSLLLASLLVVNFLPFTVGESNENDAEVWFHDTYYETDDSDGEGGNETIKIFFDLETDSNDTEYAVVELNIWRGDDEIIDEIVEDYAVSSDDVYYHEMSWSAPDRDDFCFELWIHDTDEEEWFCEELGNHENNEEDYEVWFEDVYYETDDSDGEDGNETIHISFDLDTNSEDAVETTVRINVWRGDDDVIAEIDENYEVHPNDTYYHNFSWSVSDRDLYCFEMLIHDTDEEEWFCEELGNYEEQDDFYVRFNEIRSPEIYDTDMELQYFLNDERELTTEPNDEATEEQPPQSWEWIGNSQVGRTRDWVEIGTWEAEALEMDLVLENIRFNMWWVEDDEDEDMEGGAQMEMRWTLMVDGEEAAFFEDDDEYSCEQDRGNPCEWNAIESIDLEEFVAGQTLSVKIEYSSFRNIFIYYGNETFDSGFNFGGKETIFIIFNLETNNDESVEATIQINIWRGDDEVIDEIVETYEVPHPVNNTNMLSWVAPDRDYFCFEMLIHDHDDEHWFCEEFGNYDINEEQDEYDVWFEDDYYETDDSDGENGNETIHIFFDLESSTEETVEATVQMNVWRGDDEVIEEIVTTYVVHHNETYYHQISWSASDRDLYCFELWIHDTDEEDWFCEELGNHEEDDENNAPELFEGWVTPQEGTTEDDFRFEVIYCDVDDTLPEFVKLRLLREGTNDFETYQMEQGHPEYNSTGNHCDEGYYSWYHFVMSGSDIGLGSHEYSFIASDSEDVVDTDWYEGPTVTEVDDEIDPEYDVIVAIEPPSRQVQSGDVANFVITVLNTGNVEDTFDVSYQTLFANTSASGWQVSMAENEVTLASGMYATITLTVSVPQSAQSNDTFIFKVMAVSQSDAPTDGSAFASVLVSDQMFTIPGLGVVGTFAALGSAGVVAPFRRYLRNR